MIKLSTLHKNKASQFSIFNGIEKSKEDNRHTANTDDRQGLWVKIANADQSVGEEHYDLDHKVLIKIDDDHVNQMHCMRHGGITLLSTTASTGF